MAEIVFILGAGASMHAGAPLCKGFLDASERLVRQNSVSSDEKSDFELVLEARHALMGHSAKSRIEVDNVEALFGAFEMAALFAKLNDLAPEKVARLPIAMNRVIARTIELTFRFPVVKPQFEDSSFVIVGTRPKLQPRLNTFCAPTVPYGAFARLLSDLTQKHRKRVAVLTFNYDVGLDLACEYYGIPFTYGLDDSDSGFDLLKLHGSLNWGRCLKAECRAIQVLSLETFLNKFTRPRDFLEKREVQLDISQALPSLQHCGFALEAEPMIVPPTWNKGKYHTELARVWRKAAGHLADAERIYVSGYSYPETDEFFRYLYALGSIGRGWLRRFAVYNPAKGEEANKIKDRFTNLMGGIAMQRFVYLGNEFETAAEAIEQDLEETLAAQAN